MIGINDNIIEQLNINAKIEKKYNLESNVCEFGFEQKIGSNVIGTGGKLKKEILEKFEISKDVYFAEYNLSQIKKLDKLVRKSQPLLKYPKVFRDFSFILDKKITYSEIFKYNKRF